MLNKRGDPSIVLLVLLVVVVFSGAIYSFISNSRNVDAKLSAVGNVDDILSEEEKLNSYLQASAQRTFAQTYNGFVYSRSYMGTQIVDAQGNYEFSSLNSAWKEDFKSKLKSRFILEFSKYEYEKGFSDFVKEGNFEVEENEEGFVFVFNEYNLTDEKDGYEARLKFSPQITVSYLDYGLESFDELYFVKEECKVKSGESEIETCFGSLEGFNADVSKFRENYLVKLTSKKDFSLAGFDFVEAEFVMK